MHSLPGAAGYLLCFLGTPQHGEGLGGGGQCARRLKGAEIPFQPCAWAQAAQPLVFSPLE